MRPVGGWVKPAGGVCKNHPDRYNGPFWYRRVVGQCSKGPVMSRVCHFTGKRTVSGRKYDRRGKAKYLGGVGRKITGKTKRKFKPNIQKVRALVDGKVVRVKVSAKAIRDGYVVKPPKRDWKPQEETATAEHPSS